VEYKPAQAQVTATVTVNNATSLAVGATATVYIPIAPFGGYEGDTMTLTVNDLTKEIFLSKDVDFTAGRIKNLNFSYVVEEEPEPEVPAFEPGEYWIVANGKYAMPITSTYGYLQVDNNGYTDNVFTFAEAEGGYTIQQADGKYVYMKDSFDSFNVSATVPSAGGHVWTIEKNDDGSYKILNVLKQKYIQLDSTHGTYGSYNTVNGTMPNLVPAENATIRPVFKVAANSMTVACDETEASFDITSNQSWTVVPGEGVSVDVTSGNGNGTVTMTFAENDTEEAVTYTATVKSEGFEDIVLTVTQKGVPVAGEPTVIFEESFKASTGTMGWDGTNGNGTFKADNTGWTVENAYGAGGSAKFGTSTKKGKATTPALSLTGTATLTFKAGAWNNGSESTTLKLSMTGGTLSVSSVTLKKAAWTEYEVTITGATEGAKITFEANIASKNRFFLDDVKITQ
jgi:hypothetical protein